VPRPGGVTPGLAERDIDRKGQNAGFVGVLLEEGEAKVEGKRGGGDGGVINAQAHAHGNTVLVQLDRLVHRARVEEHHAREQVLVDGLADLGPGKEPERAADWVFADAAGVVADAPGGNAAEVKASEALAAQVVALVEGV
jgi:hypothetical protein